MARRIDIELTSARPDGSWTWRAAGALKPRGVLDGTLLSQGAKPGDVLRVDAEFEIEGITIVAVLPPKEKRSEPERLEIIGPPRAATPGVTTSLTRPPRDDDGPRRPRRDAGSDPARNGNAGSGRSEHRAGGAGGRGPGGAAGSGEPAGPGPDPERREGDEGAARSRPPRAEGADRSGAGPRPARQDRPRVDRGSRPGGPASSGVGPSAGDRRSGAPTRAPRPARPRPEPVAATGDGDTTGRSAPPAPDRPKPRRLSAGSAHRNALLESLPPEHRPIAEQVIRGGIPAVRTALHLEAEKATAEGRPAPHAEALLAIAEDLLPKVKTAEWRDRADAAVKLGDELPLRDLRSILDGASAARDDESRSLAASLREALERRVETMRSAWIEEIQANLADTRVVRALRLSARPPDATMKLPSDLATQLTEAAGKAMSSDTPSERWAAMLEAVAASPVRRQVKPEGLPSDATEPLLQAARQQSGRVPALAALLGISMPPPPGPVRVRPATPAP